MRRPPEDQDALGEADRQEIEAGLQAIEGATGRFHIDDRGAITDGRLDVAVPGLEDLGDQFASLSVPVPDDAVGAGASWIVTQEVAAEGLPIEQAIVVEPLDRDGDLVRIGQTIEGTSPPGPVDLVPGAEVEIVELVTTGSGTSELDLSQPLPLRGESTGRTEQELTIDEGAGTQTLRQAIEVSASFETE